MVPNKRYDTLSVPSGRRFYWATSTLEKDKWNRSWHWVNEIVDQGGGGGREGEDGATPPDLHRHRPWATDVLEGSKTL